MLDDMLERLARPLRPVFLGDNDCTVTLICYSVVVRTYFGNSNERLQKRTYIMVAVVMRVASGSERSLEWEWKSSWYAASIWFKWSTYGGAKSKT